MNTQPKALEISQDHNDVIDFNSRHKAVANLSKGYGVLASINKIQQDLIEQGGVGKNQKTKSDNVKFSYSYRGIDDLYNAISPLMIKHDLICIPHVESWSSKQYTNNKGDIVFKTFVLVRYTLLCVTDGSSIESCLAGESNDSGDKGLSKALSMAQKYLYLQTFSIPTETDHDPDRYQSETLQQNQASQMASLEFKNEVDVMMRKFNNRLCDVLNARNIDMSKITTNQLTAIRDEFISFIQNNR